MRIFSKILSVALAASLAISSTSLSISAADLLTLATTDDPNITVNLVDPASPIPTVASTGTLISEVTSRTCSSIPYRHILCTGTINNSEDCTGDGIYGTCTSCGNSVHALTRYYCSNKSTCKYEYYYGKCSTCSNKAVYFYYLRGNDIDGAPIVIPCDINKTKHYKTGVGTKTINGVTQYAPTDKCSFLNEHMTFYGDASEYDLTEHYYCTNHSSDAEAYIGSTASHTAYSNSTYGYNGLRTSFNIYNVTLTKNDSLSAYWVLNSGGTQYTTTGKAAGGAKISLFITKPNGSNAIKVTANGVDLSTLYEKQENATYVFFSGIKTPQSDLTLEINYDRATPTYGGSDLTKTYSTTTFSSGLTTNSNGAKTFTSSNTSVATISTTGVVTLKGAGTTTLKLATARTTAYEAGSKSITLTVNRATPTFTGSDFVKYYGDAAFDCGITTTSNGGKTYSSTNSAVAGIDASGKVSIIRPGTTRIRLSTTQTAQYEAAIFDVTLTVNRYTPEFSGSNITKTYSTATFDCGITTTSNGSKTYTSTNTGVATVNSSGVVTLKGAGTTKIKLVTTQTDKYSSGTKEITLTVNRATPTYTGSDITMDYESRYIDCGITTNSNGAKTYTSSNTNVATIGGSGSILIKGCGTTTITLSTVQTAQYEAGSKSITLTVNKLDPVITFNDIEDVEYGAIPQFYISHSVTSDGTKTFTSSDTSVATISGTLLVIVGVGTTTITLNVSEGATYNAGSASVTFTVTKKKPVFTDGQLASVTATPITYGQTLSESIITGNSPVPGSFTWKEPSFIPNATNGTPDSYPVIFTPTDTANYSDVELTAQVTVNKADIPFTADQLASVTASEITYGQMLADSALTGDSPIPGTFAWADDTIVPTVADSETTDYDVVFIPDDTNNYNNYNLTAKVKVNKADLAFTPEQLASVTASEITYGQTLADSTLTGDSPVPGTFAWVDDTIAPTVADSETTDYDVVFIPDDTDNYNSFSLVSKVKVNKAVPEFTPEQLASVTATEITYGQSLADSTITGDSPVPGVFEWTAPDIKPSALDSETTDFAVTFTPNDTENYTTFDLTLKLKVNKADVSIADVETAPLTYGQTLADSTIVGSSSVTGTFSWVYPDTVPSVLDSGTTQYEAIFTPDDIDNYNTAELNLTVTVSKATPVFTPEQLASVSASEITYGQTLADSTLTGDSPVPGTFAWVDDTIAPTVADSEITDYDVVFTPDDTNNYNNYNLTSKIKVNKADLVFTPEQLASVTATDIIYGQSLADSTLTGDSPIPGTFIWADSTIKPTVADSDTTEFAVIFVPDDTLNYNNYDLGTTLTVSKADIPFTPEQLASVSATEITYGQTLADSTLTGDSPVPGTFSWADDTIAPTVADSETTDYDVVFTPDDTDNYNNFNLTSKVKVNKADPAFTPEQLASVIASEITYGQTLADSTLTGDSPISGTFSWLDSTIAPTVADSETTDYDVVFTPDDTDNYNSYNLTTKIKVNKLIPAFTSEQIASVTATEITYGQSLSDSNLSGDSPIPGTFIWADGSIRPAVADSNTTDYDVIFIPDDSVNYENFDLTTKVKVNKADPAFTPEQLASVTATEITYGQTLADSTLTGDSPVPGTFVWVDDTIAPTVADSETTDYDVVFTPDDTDNYNSYNLTAKVKVNKAYPEFTEEQENSITASEITYGEILANSIITGSTPIPGSFTWADPNDIPTVTDNERVVIFTPDDTDNYEPITFTIPVPVKKATPEITSTVTGSTLSYGQTLADSTITGTASVPGTFSWVDSSIVPDIVNNGYDVKFTPEDSDNYETVIVKASVIVNPSDIDLIVTDIVKTYGDEPFEFGAVCADAVITYTSSDATIVSVNGSRGVINSAGTVTITAKAVHVDGYAEATASFIVVVNKAMPENVTAEAERELVYGETLADIGIVGNASVPGTFEWVSGDIAPSYAESGTFYDVLFAPNDRNYMDVKISVEVTVIQKDPELPDETIDVLSASEITYGETLSYSEITGGIAEMTVKGRYAWKAPDTKPEGTDSEVTMFDVIFIPEDTNYATVDVGGLTLKVNKANPDDGEEISVTRNLTSGQFSIQDTIDSDGERSYKSTDESIARITPEGIVIPVSKGNVDIIVTALESDNYTEASQTFHVTIDYVAPMDYDYSRPVIPEREEVSEDLEDYEEEIDEEEEFIEEVEIEDSDNGLINWPDLEADPDGFVPTGVALGGIGSFILSAIAVVTFRKKKNK